jgi:hypothetical protein
MRPSRLSLLGWVMVQKVLFRYTEEGYLGLASTPDRGRLELKVQAGVQEGGSPLLRGFGWYGTPEPEPSLKPAHFILGRSIGSGNVDYVAKFEKWRQIEKLTDKR